MVIGNSMSSFAPQTIRYGRCFRGAKGDFGLVPDWSDSLLSDR